MAFGGLRGVFPSSEAAGGHAPVPLGAVRGDHARHGHKCGCVLGFFLEFRYNGGLQHGVADVWYPGTY